MDYRQNICLGNQVKQKEDGPLVLYSEKELKLLTGVLLKPKTLENVHRVKNIFGGQVVDVLDVA